MQTLLPEGWAPPIGYSNGIAVEAALAATLLLRGFTFWLPMLPGVWLARREMAGHPMPGHAGTHSGSKP